MAEANVVLSDKERMLADLFTLDEYYENESSILKILNRKDEIDKIPLQEPVGQEMDILGQTVEIEKREAIPEAYAKLGADELFEDSFKADQKTIARLKEKRPVGPKGGYPSFQGYWYWPYIVAFLSIGFGFAMLTPVFLGYKNVPPNIFFAVLGFVGGAVLIGIGLYNAWEQSEKKKDDKRYEEACLQHEETLNMFRRRQKEMFNKRLKTVNGVYAKPIRDSEKEWDEKQKKFIEEKTMESETLKHDVVVAENAQKMKTAVVQASIIPSYYLNNKDAVKRMLFLMLNKRADTVKELVNVFENEKWQQEVLGRLSAYTQGLVTQNRVVLQGLVAINDSVNAASNNVSKLHEALNNMSFFIY